MVIKKKLFVAKAALILAAIPFVIHAYETGPDPRRTGAPGDVGTCLGSGCHSGSALNAGPGNVKIILPGANTYTPGTKQHIMVQITDATRQKFGFEMTARLASDLVSNQAGSFARTDNRTAVICDDGSIAPCSAQFPVQFIEHTINGYNASTSGAFTYEFDWTPPATNQGNVTMYVAANAGPAGAAVSTNANVYTANVTLTPNVVSPSGPTVDPGGIVPVYSTSTTISPGSWVSIYSFGAKNLADSVVLWNNDFPTALGGVTVKIDNKPAYLWFVSPAQINLQVPDDSATGTVPVSITNTHGTSNTTVTLGPTGPSFLLLGDNLHATGFVYDSKGAQSLLGPAGGAEGGRPAKKGEVVAIYGVGFGPTSPAIPSGRVFAPGEFANLVTKPSITVGGVSVAVDFGGLVGAGLYQFNFTIPSNIGSGDQTLSAIAGGIQTPAKVSIPIQ